MLRLSGSVRRRPHTHGKFPSVAINDNGTVVEVHQPFIISSDMYYQIGAINGDEVDFSEERRVDAGRFPKVAINNDNCVVEVHEGKYRRRIHYNIGVLNNQRTRINWKPKPESICWGRFPAVAMSGNRVVVTNDIAIGWYSTCYRIGTINARQTAIDWGEKQKLFDSGVTETSIAINENNAVAAGRSWWRIVYRVGQFRDGAIHWYNQINYTVLGYCPTISLTHHGDVVMVWQSFNFRQLSYAVGRVDVQAQEASIGWRNGRNYDSGYNPSIAISPNTNQVLEEHETNHSKFRCTLHYHTGFLNEEEEQAAGDHENRPGAQPQVPQIQLARQLNEQGQNNEQVALEMHNRDNQ